MKEQQKQLSFYFSTENFSHARILERTRRLTSEFDSADDTVLFYEGIRHAIQILKRISPNRPIRMVDLGCNTGVPDITGICQHIIQSSLGIEISSQAVKKGERIKRLLKIGDVQMQFLRANMLDEECKKQAMLFHPTLIAGNLPYLPALPNSPKEVAGGVDGTLYVPKVILEYAMGTKAKVVTMNVCSLTNMDAVLEQIEHSSYFIHELLVLSHPFGKYTQKLYESGKLQCLDYTPYYHLDTDGCASQLMINIILLERTIGLSQSEINRETVMKKMEEFRTTGSIQTDIA